jgi:hypothetical protein
MSDPMTAAEMLPLLKQWAERHAALSKQMDALAAIFGGAFEGPLFDAVWLTWDAYTEQLSHRIGDDHEWLQWYCGDNDMGAKGLTARSWTQEIDVRTLRQLARVIVGSR